MPPTADMRCRGRRSAARPRSAPVGLARHVHDAACALRNQIEAAVSQPLTRIDAGITALEPRDLPLSGHCPSQAPGVVATGTATGALASAACGTALPCVS